MWEQPLLAVQSRRNKRMRVSLIVACLLAVGNLVAQQPAPAASETSSLVLSAPSREPVRLSATELKALPHISVTFHNSHTSADETYSGVRLADLLARLGTPMGDALRGKALANYVVATGSDGYKSVLAVGEIDPSFHPGDVIVADAVDGKPLDPHNGPFKLVVTEDKRPARSVRNVISIELRSAQ